MKKFTLFLISFCLAGVSFAGSLSSQSGKMLGKHPVNSRALPVFHHPANAKPVAGSNQIQSVPFYTNDFASGIPAGWTNVDSAGNGVVWTWTTVGCYSQGYPGFDSLSAVGTTAANGYLMFDSDSAGASVGGEYGVLTSTPINCSGHPAVRLQFNEFFAFFQDANAVYPNTARVYVSNDNTNWTMVHAADAGLGNNQATVNPKVMDIDISAIAGNQSTVYIKLSYTGDWSYFWYFDDLALAAPLADDVAMTPGYPSEYTMIPLTQTQPIDLAAQVTNAGGTVETNVGFTANVYLFQSGAWTQVVSGQFSNTAASLAIGTTSPVLSAGTFTIADTGIYAFEYISFMDNADANQTNDTLLNYIVVDDTSYARDEAVLTGSFDTNVGFPAPGTGVLGQVFDIIAASTIKSVSFYVAAPTTGDNTNAIIYSMAGGYPDQVLGTSSNYTFTAGDASGAFLTLDLTSPIAVTPGEIFVAVSQIDPNFLSVAFNNNIFTPYTAMYQATGGDWHTLDSIPLPGAFILRPNFDLSNGVTTTNFSKGISVYPNPSNGMLYIRNNGQKENMTVSVYNSVGQIVYTENYSQMLNAAVNLTGQPAGLYTVQVKSDKDIITKSIVISAR